MLVHKNQGPQISGPKIIWLKNSKYLDTLLVQKILGSKEVLSKKNVGPQKLRSPNIRLQKLGQNRLSDS